jgi:TfoX/Sxy family transcriptional regulator of competence genes
VAYDEGLDDRVADIVYPWGATRKKMFGGTGYLINGNMMAGVHGERLILRLNDSDAKALLKEPLVGPFDLTGKPMAGWVQVDLPALEDNERLEDWLMLAHVHAASLPPK